MRKLLALFVLLLGFSLVLTSASAGGRLITIGAGKTVARGTFGNIDLGFEGSTRRFPSAMQLEVTTNLGMDLNAFITVVCDGPGSAFDSATLNTTLTFPKGTTIIDFEDQFFPVDGFDLCHGNVSLFDFSQNTGTVIARLRAM